MKEYLDKEKAIMNLSDIALTVSPDESTPQEDVVFGKAEYVALMAAIDVLGEMEPADVAEVVRCKECKHNGLLSCPLVMIEKRQMVFINRFDNWFCADGEKEE